MDPQTFSIEAVSRVKGTWTLTLAPEHLEFRSPDQRTLVQIPRSEVVDRITTPPWIGGPLLHAKFPKNTAFRATPELLDALTQWRGPLTGADLKAALKRRLRWGVPLAVIVILVSLPFAGDPQAGIDPIPLDRGGMLLGFSLLVLAAIRRIWTTPKIFLADTAWFGSLAANLMHDALVDNRLWVLILVPLVIWGAYGSFSQYRRFTNAAPCEDRDPAVR